MAKMSTIQQPVEAVGERAAREPDLEGWVERDGVTVAYKVYGDGEPTVLLMPTWSIVPSRFWKAQVPYLSRHFRVITFDGRGSGQSDAPTGDGAYADQEFVADAAKQRMEIQWITGEEIQRVIAHAYGAEPQVLARARDLMKMPEKP